MIVPTSSVRSHLAALGPSWMSSAARPEKPALGFLAAWTTLPRGAHLWICRVHVLTSQAGALCVLVRLSEARRTPPPRRAHLPGARTSAPGYGGGFPRTHVHTQAHKHT